VSVKVFGVDAFTTMAFGGNPAAVCLLESAADPAWMGRVAAELNQPATAFLWGGGDGYRLRWFTPVQELPLCGHGTLAAGHVLYDTGRAYRGEVIAFSTPSGVLPVRSAGDRVWIDLPAVKLTAGPVPDGVLDALGIEDAAWFGRSDYEYVVQVDTPGQVEDAQPDPARILGFPVPRVILTAPGGTGADFTSRVFVPAIGLDEDPVTGSAHAVLGPLWAGRLGRDNLTAVQASARRGELAVAVRGDRVRVGGHAITVSHGELVV
jgi:predicted PhzF superfamily epimerase YddE/YHI9